MCENCETGCRRSPTHEIIQSANSAITDVSMEVKRVPGSVCLGMAEPFR